MMYRKTMNRWFSGMLLFVLVFALGAPASANLLYTAQTYYTNTVLGKVVGNNVNLVATGIGGDWGQGIFPFKDAQNQDQVAVTLYQGELDTIGVYNPASMEVTPLGVVNNSLQNIRKMVSLGDYLYGISYGDNPYQGLPADVAHVRRFKTTNYASDNKSFDYNPQPKQGHGEGLVAYGGHLYAILTAVTGSYPNFDYEPDKLVKLTPNLAVVHSVDLVGRNTDGGTPGAYCQDGAMLYVTSWGGNQPVSAEMLPYRDDTRIESADLSVGSLPHFKSIEGYKMPARDPGWEHYFTAIAVVNGQAYVQASRWNLREARGLTPSQVRAAGIRTGGEVRLYKVPVDQLGALSGEHRVATISFSDGWRLGLAVDGDYLYMAAGKDLYRYRLSPAFALDRTFTPDVLSGDISAFASVPSLREVFAAETAPNGPRQAEGEASNEGKKGGCDAGFGFLALLAVAPAVLYRRRG